MKELNTDTLRKALGKLPQYEAPEQVRQDLEAQLMEGSPSSIGYPRRNWFFWGIAASIILLIGTFFYFYSPYRTPVPTRVEAEQALDSLDQLEPVIEIWVADSLQQDSLVK